MDYLRLPYGQDDQPRYRYPHGGDDYQPAVNLSPYSATPPVEYDDVPYRSPPSYGGTYDQPPSPRGYRSSHSPYVEYQNYPPPPSQSAYVGDEDTNPHFKPHMPAGFLEGNFNNHHKPNPMMNGVANNGGYVSDTAGLVGPALGFLTNKPIYRIYCKAGGDRLAVAIRDGDVVLARPNPTDPTQHWYRDERYSTKVKDEERHPSFILVNKGTGQAIKHSVAGHPVQLIPYRPDSLDVSLLWTESKDLGSGFRTMRTVNNTSLVMDAWNGDKDHGGVHDGTLVALYKSWKGDNQNQQWKFVPC